MEIDAEKPVPHSYTILRIKRKRNEEPLDALVVESGVRRKKSRGGIGVFQFAQTVENDAWQDEEKQKGIQDQISRLARESSISAEMKPNVPTQDSPSPVRSRMHRDDWNRRYAILDQDDRDAQVRKPLTSPPKVISSKDLPQKKSLLPDFKMYDAVPAVDKPTVDSEMEKFLPMLNDYLISHDVSFDTKEAHLAMGKPAPASTSTSNDYVWDVFYHRPATLSEWNEAANVGTLSGLPRSIADPYDSASEEEEEDEADEDSNAEEYYKNDYPDEDDPSSDDSTGSDGFHEDSDQDDVINYDDDGDDHDWR